MAGEVFICHASADIESHVRPLWERLNALGIRAWCAPFGSVGPGPHMDNIGEAISNAMAAVVVLTPNAMTRSWPKREYRRIEAQADSRDFPIIPWFVDTNPSRLKEPFSFLADQNGVREQDVEHAASRIAELTLEALRKSITVAPRPLHIAVSSYNPKEDWHGEPDLFFAVPPQAAPSDSQRLVEGLRWLRRHLGGHPRPAIEVQPRCTIALGVAIGAILYETWGGQVTVIQQVRDVAHRWPLVRDAAEPPDVTFREHLGPDAPKELHLSISLNNPVEPLRLRWPAPESHIALIVEPTDGTLRNDFIRSGVHAMAIADAVSTRVKGLRARYPTLERVRLFLAGPQVFSLALGRQLNAQGEWALMDLNKESSPPQYVERLVLST